MSLGRFETYVHPEWRLIVAAMTLGVACYLPIGGNVTQYHVIFIGILVLVMQFLKQIYLAGLSLIVMLGLLNSQISVEPRFNDTPIKDGQFYNLAGTVIRVEERSDNSLRLTVENDSPQFVARVTIRNRKTLSIEQGQRLKISAILSRPAGPAVPYGYNFARDAFFKGIDAQGFAVSPVQIDDTIDAEYSIDAFRQQTAKLLYERVGGQNGAVAAALLVGEKSYLSEETKENLRKAGLAHLLAISGLHIGLVAAIGFFVFEYIFALIPALAFRVMPRKFAVLPTFLLVVIYLMISGASVATIRAVIMISVAMMALLTDRRVISLRSVAIAAIVILLIWPENIVSISFQLSFAATASLVAFYEWFSRSELWRRWQSQQNLWRKFLTAIFAVMLTSLISQMGILPFALYHFQEISVIALISNVLVLPLVSFLVMPLLLCILVGWTLFGIMAFTIPLGLSIGVIRDIAAWSASFSWATAQTYQLTDIGFVILTLIFMGMLLVREPRVFFALLILVPGVFLLSFRKPADILIDRNASFIAVHDNDKMAISSKYRDNFRNKIWLKYWATSKDDIVQLKRSCDQDACLYELTGDRYLGIIKTIDAVRPVCNIAEIIIIPTKYKRLCRTGALIITNADLQKRGPLGLSYQENSITPIMKWSVSEHQIKPWQE
ncbi:ComEC family competence protein [Kordiimonas sp. SCSIO 12603]|uniref:ComEC/Rec2 family competence protein n=1 Tax=Kordiimonas sp. SCSIO 12603 TaxID=2829596 RepID=UPI0021035E6A|nr:ComEC/Rec2 family competence protein [Kordiimonas sp. SCSIO 12603]UTW57473.1 ComEC family competence protein [Kordiimonas sp. SCSIO 12603]